MYEVSVRNLQKKKLLRIPKFRCEESIKIDQRVCGLMLTAPELGPKIDYCDEPSNLLIVPRL